MEYRKIFNNLILGILVTLLSVIGLVSIPYAIEKRRAFMHVPFQASTFPTIIFTVGMILGILLILLDIYRKYFVSKNLVEQPNEKTNEFQQVDLKSVLPILLLYFAYILLLDSLGFISVSFLFLFLSMKYLGVSGKNNYLLIFLISIITVFSTYYIFRGLFGVTLPVGVWAPKIVH